jgi:drug/metabolite transporter (DMT)-like permease
MTETNAAATTSLTAHATGRGKLVAHVAMLAFAALVAGSYSVGAMAAPHVGPAAINALRFVFGVAVMAGVALVMMRGSVPAPTAVWRYAILGGLMAVFFVTMFIALRLTNPVSAGAVFTLMPLMAAFFGWLFLGQAPSGIVLSSLVFAGLGAVWVIFDGDVDALLAFDLGPGEAIFLLGCACHAAYAPLVRRFNRGEPLVVFTLWTLAATGLWIAVYGAWEIVATDWTALPAIVWIAIGYLAVFTTAGTTFIVQFAAMRLPASKVLAYTYLTPCCIILFEGALGHGWAPPEVAAGALVTVMGLLVLALSRDG